MEQKRILIADDSLISRRKMKSYINLPNAIIEEALNGKDALEKIKEQNYDCIILDLLMPEYDGFYFLENYKSNDKRIPIIVVSADIQETSKRKIFELGANDFLNKPPSVEDLNNSLAKLINQGEL